MIRPAAIVLLVIASATRLVAQDAAPAPASAAGSTLAGVYTDVQATRGEGLFKKICLECHVVSDYQDDAFKSKFVGGTVFDMFEQIRTSMPQNDPGSLQRQEYADLVAFLFKINGLPTGPKELSTVADSLKLIKVEAKPKLFLHTTFTHGTFTGLRHGSPHFR